MGFCPYLSSVYLKETTYNTQPNNSTGGTITETHVPGTAVTPVTGILSFQCPQNTTCQLWSNATGTCGTISGPVLDLMKSNHDASIAEFNTVVGASADSDAGASLLKYLKNIVGASAELDQGQSLVEYLKNIVGASAELDQGQSLTRYLKTIVGVSGERDQGQSLTNYLKTIIGASAELDQGQSLVRYLKSIVGASAELDGGRSLMNYLKNIVGTNTEKDSATVHAENDSLIKLFHHIHSLHDHGLDPEYHAGDEENAMSLYTTYIMENASLSDINGDGLIYNTYVTGNTAYNDAVAALVPSPLPDMLKGVQVHELPAPPAGFP